MICKKTSPLLMTILVTGVLAVGLQAQEPAPRAVPQAFADNDQLSALIRDALESNPLVRQAFSRYQAALARPAQAGSLPDPMIGITQYVRSPETRVGPQTTMMSITQQLPWFGKLRDREDAAAKQAAAMGEMYEAQKAEIVRQVKIAYYSLAYVDSSLAITQEDLALLGQYETLAQARYSQGVGLQQSVIKLQAEITRDRNRLEQLQSRRIDAEAALNALLDRPAGTPIASVSLPARQAVTVSYEELYARGRDNRPEIRAAFLQIETDEKRVQLAHRNFWPDLTVGASFVNVNKRSDAAGVLMPPDQNGKNIFSLSVSLNIPIQRRRYDAALVEATQDRISSQAGYRNAINQLEASVRATGFRIQTLEEQMALFENTLVPQAEQALRSSEAAYATGAIGVLDLLDSERVLLDVKLGLAQLDSDYRKSLAEMERSLGVPFPEVKP